ncbi:radical SAM protein [Methanosarcina sp. Z-7115]|uniref:Radical SAM protein n=1 Tax=Methanosarcina baikalica TaxID=3073890 RepID=A0ABU2D5D7_9EURY|nr:radical SAM protein [Methanosarcina sp. Z-7115]MDR7667047.1 radical SAM protein [Methanosarcina sp. Z-7115]
MDIELNATNKAELISIGSVQVDKSLLPNQLKSKATAGPGAGGSSIFLRSGNRRVRLTINDFSPLRAVPEDEHVVVMKGDDVIARGVLERPLCHCPEQAYITLSEKCVYDCQFCPVPKMQGEIKDSAKVLQMVAEAHATGELKAISLTSGVAVSPKKEVQRAVDIIKQLTREYDLPIGVSVYPTTGSSEELYSAGACEVKYNVETMDPKLFRRFCPDLSLYTVLDALDTAVNIFGRNRVSSNFIIGLGESDEIVRKGIKHLTDRCIIPILRPISPHPLRKEVKINRPDAERLLKLGSMLKDMLDRQSLCVDESRTMCLFCTGCDLAPHIDL